MEVIDLRVKLPYITWNRNFFPPWQVLPMPEESPDHGRKTNIELQAIEPSPFQRRQHFEEDKLKWVEWGTSYIVPVKKKVGADKLQ